MTQLNTRIDDVTRSQLEILKTKKGVGIQLLIKQLVDDEFKRVKLAERYQTEMYIEEAQIIG